MARRRHNNGGLSLVSGPVLAEFSAEQGGGEQGGLLDAVINHAHHVPDALLNAIPRPAAWLSRLCASDRIQLGHQVQRPRRPGLLAQRVQSNVSLSSRASVVQAATELTNQLHEQKQLISAASSYQVVSVTTRGGDWSFWSQSCRAWGPQHALSIERSGSVLCWRLALNTAVWSSWILQIFCVNFTYQLLQGCTLHGQARISRNGFIDNPKGCFSNSEIYKRRWRDWVNIWRGRCAHLLGSSCPYLGRRIGNELLRSNSLMRQWLCALDSQPDQLSTNMHGFYLLTNGLVLHPSRS